MAYRFEFDESRCANCGACAVACMDQNDIFPERGDKGFRTCMTVEQGHGMEAKMRYLSVGCIHCTPAPCVEACPVGCLYKDKETGLTLYDNSSCIGCRSCLRACPFDVPGFNQQGVIVKCDGCEGRLKVGMEPACVRVCPYDALKVVCLSEKSI